MARSRQSTLVDRDGVPFAPRIEQILLGLTRRLRRQFPHLREELALVEVLEEVGRRLALREQLRGELANVRGYAWVVARSVAISSLRSRTRRMEGLMTMGHSGEISLHAAVAQSHTADQIESEVLLNELLRSLNEEDRRLFEMKLAGFSSAEIAQRLGRSIGSIDTSYSRATAHLRAVLGGDRNRPRTDRPVPPAAGKTVQQVPGRSEDSSPTDSRSPSRRRPASGSTRKRGRRGSRAGPHRRREPDASCRRYTGRASSGG